MRRNRQRGLCLSQRSNDRHRYALKFLLKSLFPHFLPVTVLGPISQRSFLTRMRIQERTQALVDAADSKEQKDRLQDATDRLLAPIGMGSQYQFLGIVSKTSQDGQGLSYPFGHDDLYII
jgi:hypothetical protein